MRRYCGCDKPSMANYYLSVVLLRDVPGGTESEEPSLYLCNLHMPCEDAIDGVLAESGYAGWELAEYEVSHLR